jgi:hypothetical protein
MGERPGLAMRRWNIDGGVAVAQQIGDAIGACGATCHYGEIWATNLVRNTNRSRIFVMVIGMTGNGSELVALVTPAAIFCGQRRCQMHRGDIPVCQNWRGSCHVRNLR